MSEAKVKVNTEAKPKPPVIDKRSIIALAAAEARMNLKRGVPYPSKGGYHRWNEEDETLEGIAIVQHEERHSLTNLFMMWVEWEAPAHLLPSGSGAPRYIRMEVVPEGVMVKHYLGLYGTTFIGLPGMPKGKDSISPRVQYLTAPDEEKFIDMIFRYLSQE